MKRSTVQTLKSILRSLHIFCILFQRDAEFYSRVFVYVRKFIRLALTQGLEAAVKWNKEVRLLYTKFLADDPNLPDGSRVSKNSRAPKELTHFREILDDPYYRRIILSILYFTRAFKGGSEPNLSTVTEPSSMKTEVVNRLRKGLPDFLCSLNVRKPYLPRMKEWHCSSKNGPNGHAMTSLWRDLSLLTDEHIKDLETLGGSTYKMYIDSNKEFISSQWWEPFVTIFKIIQDKSKNTLAKIITIPDSEIKTRIIGMGNYWFQTVLKPLHDYQFSLLRRLSNDATFNQGKAKDCLNKPSGHKYWSFDLTAATDRFPIEIQTMFLSNLTSPEYTLAWQRVINPTFTYRGNPVKYGTGQPIGFYSSWSTFSLCHHLVAHVSCIEAGVKPKGIYIILGDDIVIAHDEVARIYKEIIKDLGIEINMGKTHVSSHSWEFAKRWYHEQNGEFSPFPVNAIASANYTTDVLDSFYIAKEKGWVFPLPIPICTAITIQVLKSKYGDKVYDNYLKVATMNHNTIQSSLGLIPWESTINSLVEDFKLERLGKFDELGAQLINLVFKVEILSKGLSQTMKSKFEVDWWTNSGGLPSNIIREDVSRDTFKPDNIPHLSISRKVVIYFLENIAFSNFADTLKSIVTKNKRSVLVKDLTTLFFERKQNLDWGVTTSFSKKLLVILKKINKYRNTDRPDQEQFTSAIIFQILHKHLHDSGIIGFILNDFPELRDFGKEAIRLRMEEIIKEPVDQEDIDYLLDEGAGLSADKRCIKGFKVKDDGNIDNYIFWCKDIQTIQNRATRV